MKKIWFALICLILLVSLTNVFGLDLHPGNNTQGDIPTVAASTEITTMPLYTNSEGLVAQNANLLFVYCGAILLTATALALFRKQFYNLFSMLRKSYSTGDLEARVRLPLKFPMLAGC